MPIGPKIPGGTGPARGRRASRDATRAEAEPPAPRPASTSADGARAARAAAPAIGAGGGEVSGARLSGPQAVDARLHPSSELRARLQRFDGAGADLEAARPIAAALSWVQPHGLLPLARDGGLPAPARVLVSDVLAARAAELDPSAWKDLVKALRDERGVVAENLVEALVALAPQIDGRSRALVRDALPAVRARAAERGEDGVVRRVDILARFLDESAPGPRPPSLPLASTASSPLSREERARLLEVVPVDDEAAVNARIPADLPRSARFEADFYSKGAQVAGTPGVVVVDTGNALEPGVHDHHQLGERTCAAALVLNRVDLLVAHQQAQPITKLVCHTMPDLDAVTAWYLASRILRDGRAPEGASALATYVSKEDNARLPVGDQDPTTHLAALAKAAIALSEERHPSGKPVPKEVDRARDEDVLATLSGVLDYVLASGKAPDDASLFQDLDDKPASLLPQKTKEDIRALQRVVQTDEDAAKARLQNVTFADGALPRLDGKGVMPVRVGLSRESGKRLDQMMREREGADIVVFATKDYTWVAAEPTAGASLRKVGATFEALERQKARGLGVDRLPALEDDAPVRIQPGWSVKNPFYIGGTDTFVVTARGCTLTGEERLAAFSDVTGARFHQTP